MGSTLTFGSPKSGWPSFCPTCGKRTDVCDAHADRSHLICEGAYRRSMGLSDRPST